MKLQENNYYGFDHAEVDKMFSGGLTYINTFQIPGCGEDPWAVYRASNPDTKKGHKEFMLLKFAYDPIFDKKTGLVSGMAKEELRKHRYQDGLHCKNCDTVIWSQHRHDFHPCACRSKKKVVVIDGGRDYLRYVTNKDSNFEIVKIDLFKNAVKLYPRKKKE